MQEVYLVRKMTRRTAERYETIEVFDNLDGAIKWYKHTIEELKKPGNLLYYFEIWGYKEDIDFEITEDEKDYRYYAYDFDLVNEVSVFIQTKPLRK